MNKADLIDALRKEPDLTTSNAQRIVDIFFDGTTQLLQMVTK